MDDSVLFDADDSFLDMKVAELRAELKVRNLPVNGTKSELIARLQEAAAAAVKDSNDDDDDDDDASSDMPSQVSLFADSQISMTDGNEDEILNDIPDSPTKDTGELFTEKSIPLTVKDTSDESKPIKKRELVSPSNGATAPPEKRVCLNRTTHVIVPPPSTPAIETAASTHQKITMMSVTASSEGTVSSKKPVSSIKIITAQEKLAIRAERFHTVSTGVTKIKITGKGTAPVVKSNVKAPITTLSNAPDMDKLKKRAERFGVVSTVLKKIEEKDKVKKRQMRFASSSVSLSAPSTIDETLQKKVRLQKFGIS